MAPEVISPEAMAPDVIAGDDISEAIALVMAADVEDDELAAGVAELHATRATASAPPAARRERRLSNIGRAPSGRTGHGKARDAERVPMEGTGGGITAGVYISY